MAEEQNNTLGVLAREVARALKPLVNDGGVSSENKVPEFFEIILEGAGITLDRALGSETIQAIQNALGKISTAYQKLARIVEREEPPSLADIEPLVMALQEAFQGGRELSNLQLKAYQQEDLLVEIKNLGQIVTEYLIAEYLQDSHPTAFNLLLQIGMIEMGDLYADKLERRLTRLNLAQLAAIVRDAKAAAKNLYGWSGTDFEPYRLLAPLGFLMQSLGFPAVFAFPDEADGQALGWDDTAKRPDLQLRLPLFREEGNASLQAGFAVLPLRDSKGVSDGLAIVPYGVGNISQTADVGQNWELDYRFAGNLTVRYGVIARFSGVTIKPLDANAPSTEYELRVSAGLSRKTVPGKRFALFGQGDLGVVEVAGLGLRLGFAFKNGEAEFLVELPVKDAQIALKKKKGDGFLNRILPEGGLNAPFEFTLGFSSQRGLYLQGGLGLEKNFPIHKDLFGVLRFDILHMQIKAASEGEPSSASIDVVAAADFTVKFGPFNANVQRLGLTGKITFPENGGNLGVANLALAFNPPNGAGMVIDSTAIVGGGYLLFDPKNEQYAGILQLEIKGGISLKAIGLLTTRLPGLPPGTKGFSLLVIITGEFPPIPLGFGFTLNGVGGLLGVNRTMVLEVLRAGVKNRTLDSIMFPQDPVKNAQKIISDLQSVFPPVSGRFVFGPMAILAWGKPATILTIELGIVLELPSPVQLAIMGQLTMVLPSKEVPAEAQVAVLRMDVLGTIEFEKGEAAIDATIYDSRIAAFPITGDMAMRLNWGASPAFALSAGGFNPRFQPPPNFPSLGRMAIALATGDNPRIRLEAYLALTSNTVQLGARLDMYAKATVEPLGDFTATAYLGFDALATLSPFSFIVDIGGCVCVKGAGQQINGRLDLILSGPQPWHAHGEAIIEFLGKHRIPIDVRIGDEPALAALPPGDPFKDLCDALNDTRNWSAQLSGDGHSLVTLRKFEVSKELLVHPFGELTVRQKVVPLDVEIAKFGSTTPASRGPFEITSIRFGAQTTEQAREEVRDHFAPGQFFDLSDEEKLSLPAFQPLPSGCTRIGTKEVSFSSVQIGASFQYDTVVIDNKEELKSRKDESLMYEMAQVVFGAMATLGAAGQSAMRSTGSAKFAGSDEQRVTFKDPEYAVASKDDLAREATFESYVEAEAARRQKAAASANYQTVGRHEVV